MLEDWIICCKTSRCAMLSCRKSVCLQNRIEVRARRESGIPISVSKSTTVPEKEWMLRKTCDSDKEERPSSRTVDERAQVRTASRTSLRQG